MRPDGAHEDRVLHAEVVKRKEATEVAHVAQNALVECSTYGFLDTDHCFVGTCQGHSCVCVIHLFSFALIQGIYSPTSGHFVFHQYF